MLIQLEGHSMSPTFCDGDILSVDTKAYLFHPPQPGDIVVANHPFIKNCLIVKRVCAVDDNGRFVLHGDNAIESSDSRGFGSIALQDICGKVIGKSTEEKNRCP